MIPPFINVSGALWPLLPPGIHEASLTEVYDRYALNPHRKKLFNGLKQGLDNLFNSGCRQAYLDGSYVTAKPNPGDYEICWDGQFVDPDLLDPLFLDPTGGTMLQKRKYLGEYFPSWWLEGGTGMLFIDFFQTDKDTGVQKGIIKLTNYIK